MLLGLDHRSLTDHYARLTHKIADKTKKGDALGVSPFFVARTSWFMPSRSVRLVLSDSLFGVST